MTKVFIAYNPYRMQTELKINDAPVAEDSSLASLTKNKRLQEWIGGFMQELASNQNTRQFDITFKGFEQDYEDVQDAFAEAKKTGVIAENCSIGYIGGRTTEDVKAKVEKIYNDLQEADLNPNPFREEWVTRAYNAAKETVFPVYVVATMSAGKSTLINALLGHTLMPSKNQACTATVTEILDNDCMEQFAAIAYGEGDVELRRVPELTYDIMKTLNDSGNVTRIAAEGNIPFVNSRDMKLKVLDTPGPNNARTQEHRKITLRAINNYSNGLIIYILNTAELSTEGDSRLLSAVADQIKKCSKQMRDRFIFVLNKVDNIKADEPETPEQMIQDVKGYLHEHEIDDPIVFPCSARTALLIREKLAGKDIDALTMQERKQCREALRAVEDFTDSDRPEMYLEQYSTLSPHAKRELEARLRAAEDAGDLKEQALIHSGICSIEAAIKAYVEKYAKTKQIKDLAESFEVELQSQYALASGKIQISEDGDALKAVEQRIASINAKIESGENAKEFKARIDALDPMDSIREQAEALQLEAISAVNKIFSAYDEELNSQSETESLLRRLQSMCIDKFDSLTVKLEAIINKEIVDAGNKIIDEYQKELKKMDDDAHSTSNFQLDFSSADLVKGALHTMASEIEAWKSPDFAVQTAREYGEEETYEEDRIVEVGEEKITVCEGTKREKVGTEKVIVGEHLEENGTKMVVNPKRKGMFFWAHRKYIEVPDYKSVLDYEDRDIFEDKPIKKIITRPITKHITETKTIYTAQTAEINADMNIRLQESLNNGIDSALDEAEKLIARMKAQFAQSFDELDRQIQAKYAELESAKNEKDNLEEQRAICDWLKANQDELNEALDI